MIASKERHRHLPARRDQNSLARIALSEAAATLPLAFFNEALVFTSDNIQLLKRFQNAWLYKHSAPLAIDLDESKFGLERRNVDHNLGQLLVNQIRI